MNTSVIDQPLSPGIISIDMAGQVFTHKLRPPPLSPADNAVVLDLASPLYNPGATIDGVSKVYDRSGYGNHGTITGAAWEKLPSGLWYLDFDGADNVVNCGSGSSLQSTSGITLEVWANGLFSSNDGLIDYEGFTQNGYTMAASGGRLYCAYGSGLTSWSLNSGAGSLPTDNIWKHLVFTAVDASATSDVAIYFDGSLIVGSTVDCSALAYTGSLIVGSTIGLGKWQGPLGLVRIYNRALSAGEVQNHFNQERHLFNA